MALTKDFKDTIPERALRDPAFRLGLLEEGIVCLLAGDLDTGKTLLRDYINATVGFEALARLTNKSPKSLTRMFSPVGNPRVDNLFAVIVSLQEQEGIQFHVYTTNS